MTVTKHITFANLSGHLLSALIEKPIASVKCYAIYAHCFSCGKDIHVAARMARSLASRGIAVLRFDFTGIGNSEGKFEESNFTANINDISAAANYLREHFEAPQLLIGHSLGGTAILNAAKHIPEAEAVATIAAPSCADHMLLHFQHALAQLEIEDRVSIEIAGKSLSINRDFVDDLKSYASTEQITQLHKALLVLHSPLDDVVSIDEATKIFTSAKHPKSFVSLDTADHLVSSKDDIEYIANTIAAWASRYINNAVTGARKIQKGEVFIGEGNKNFLREVASDDHVWFSDEPASAGGDNIGPDPYEQLLSSLGACTSMTLRMYAKHKGWPVDDIQVELKHSRQHERDCNQPDKSACRIELIEKFIKIKGLLDEQQANRLIEVADRCPVHKTLLGNIKLESNFKFVHE